MKYSKVLRQLGLIGFDKQEAAILSALVADIPILQWGDHGQCKTRGSEAISRSLLGSEGMFQPHDYSRMVKEELVGITDPKSLSEGELRFIPGPTTVWGVNGERKAMLFDEFSQGNVMMGSMVHELLTHKTVMGQKTAVKLPLAACNPPDGYEVNFINLATASRFVLVKIPSAAELLNDDINAVLDGNDEAFSSPPLIIRKLVLRARRVKISVKERKRIRDFAVAIGREMVRFLPAVKYSTRQLKYLYRLLLAARRLEIVGYELTLSSWESITYSTIPEMTPLVSSSVDGDTRDGIVAAVRIAISGIATGETREDGLVGLVLADKTDLLAWRASIETYLEEHIDEVTDVQARRALKILQRDRKQIREDVFNFIYGMIHEPYLDKSALPSAVLDLPLWGTNGLEESVGTLLNLPRRKVAGG